MDQIKLSTPLTDDVIDNLRAGQRVALSGRLYTARDAAHKKLIELLDQGRELPIDLKGEVIFYTGPTPARPGHVIGSAGPTTSERMDAYTPRLLALGLKGTIGKGRRSKEVIEALQKYKAIYFIAFSGAAALISKCIKEARIVAYPELDAEAIYELVVEDLPVRVMNDAYGGEFSNSDFLAQAQYDY